MSNLIQTTINDNPYKIGLSFVLKTKINNTSSDDINWTNIKQFKYTDDISEIGLFGEIIIHDDGGVYKPYFDIAAYIFLKFEIIDEQTGYTESILFDMIDIQPINVGLLSSGCDYRVSLVEAFVGEGSNKSLKAFVMANEQSVDDKNIHSLVPFAIEMLKKKITISGDENSSLEDDLGSEVDSGWFSSLFKDSPELSDAEYIDSFVGIDSNSIDFFKNNHPSDILGEEIYSKIPINCTITEFLQEINKNFYCPNTLEYKDGRASSVDIDLGEPCTLRCENLSNLTTLEGAHTVEKGRKIILRSIRDTFTECFQNNNVYEIILDQNNTNYDDGLKAKFINNNSITNIGSFPINKALTGKEWTDFITLNFGEDENGDFEGKRYKIKALTNSFDQKYLYNKRKNNIPLSSKYSSYGYNTKDLLYNSSKLSYASAAKVIKSFFTLNDTTVLTLPGHIYRKCNEIVYVDRSMSNIINSGNSLQVTFGGTLIYDYYYVTKVVHTFNGQKYENQLYICGFSNKISK